MRGVSGKNRLILDRDRWRAASEVEEDELLLEKKLKLFRLREAEEDEDGCDGLEEEEAKDLELEVLEDLGDRAALALRLGGIASADALDLHMLLICGSTWGEREADRKREGFEVGRKECCGLHLYKAKE